MSFMIISLNTLIYPHPHCKTPAHSSIPKEEPPITIGMIGQPNVGKSTLLNNLLNKERTLTSPIAGTTVDAIAEEFIYKDRHFKIVDTAGLRRNSKIIKGQLEDLSCKKTFSTLEQSDVLLLLLDASSFMVEKQDLRIFSRITQFNKIPIVILNKIDLLDNVSRQQLQKQMAEIFSKKMAQIRTVTTFAISALNHKKLGYILDKAQELYKKSHTTITTGALNRWLQNAIYNHAPPRISGKVMKLKYAVQTSTHPIRITIFTNLSSSLPTSYKRYLSNSFGDHFHLYGIPIKINFKAGDNPYVTKKEKTTKLPDINT